MTKSKTILINSLIFFQSRYYDGDQDKLFSRRPSLAAPSPPLRILMKLIALPTIRSFRALRISITTSQEWEEVDQRWEDPLTEVYLLFLAAGRMLYNVIPQSVVKINWINVVVISSPSRNIQSSTRHTSTSLISISDKY